MTRLLGVIILSAFLFPAAALAAAAGITAVVVEKEPLAVSFAVEGAFTPEMEDAVKSGLPASFDFFVRLEKVNPVLPNESVAAWSFRHTVQYKSLLDEYEVTIGEAGDRTFKVKGAGEMKRLMTGFRAGLDAPALIPGASYRLSVRSELGALDVPFLPDYARYFIEPFSFRTGWHDYDFTN